MTVHRLVTRVERLEEQRDRRRPLMHEEAIALLDAYPASPQDGPVFKDEELDAAWDRLRAEWREQP